MVEKSGLPGPKRGLSKVRETKSRICEACGNPRRACDFTVYPNWCRHCLGPDGQLDPALKIQKTRSASLIADAVRKMAEKNNPDMPEIVGAAVDRMGGRMAVGEMIANDFLMVTGRIKDDGSIRTDLERAKDKSVRALLDHKSMLRAWEIFGRLGLANDSEKRMSNWAEGLDLHSLDSEYKGMLIDDLRDDPVFHEQVLLALLETQVLIGLMGKNPALLKRLFRGIIGDERLMEVFDETCVEVDAELEAAELAEPIPAELAEPSGEGGE